MKRIIILFLLLSASALAQEGIGYLFAAPGRDGGATIQGGVGGEMVWRWVGLGSDVSYLAPQSSFSSGVGVWNLDPSFHFKPHEDSRIDPYFTGGYTLLFRGGEHSGGNYGVGVNWWFARDVGLRVELRDQVVEQTHYWGVRFGVNFHVF